ncbi:M56 family metallopeptidase [Mucilaginibacter sp. L196]|uniref:M56 family metallopeptidase n=1 Tax=Mucilaginibacter sp. L196 TaxID=1641870 RepID=UPI00131A9029|nr:M56 family metallopeptidase [Mucilaginibacter sp. L196]
MNWLHYLLEANLYLAVFYALYYLFLRNDTHYALSRIYLLATSVISFVIPLLQLGFLKSAEPKPIAITLIPLPQSAVIHYTNAPVEVVHFTWQDGLIGAYFLGVAVLLIIFSIKIYQLFKLTRASNAETDASYKLIYVDDSNTAFSFFNFLFIGTKASGADTIIQHELVHIRQKHSVDIIFIELLKIVNWFNPFIYLLQASLKALHEYIADEQTATEGNDVIAYSTFLVNNAYGLGGSSITHSFFNYNLLKKRIIMLNQQRSGNLARLKYLLAIPVCAGLLCASTLAFSKSYGLVDIAPAMKTDTPKHVHFMANNNVINYNYTYTTTKGYHVVEAIHNSNGGGGISKKVIITDKDGSKHTYYDEKISTDERKMLLDKYGYKFPSGKLMNVKLLPPPPPVPTPPGKNIKLAPPPPPAPVQPKAENRPHAPSLLKNFTLVRPGANKLPPPPPTVAPIKTTKLLLAWPSIPGFFTKSEKGC